MNDVGRLVGSAGDVDPNGDLAGRVREAIGDEAEEEDVATVLRVLAVGKALTAAAAAGIGALLLAPAALGAPPAKLTICHVPPGNPGNAHTIVIGAPAWPAHEAHGDYLGPCKDEGGGTPPPPDPDDGGSTGGSSTGGTTGGTAAPSGELPHTGGGLEAALLGGIGALLLTTGTVDVLRRRRRLRRSLRPRLELGLEERAPLVYDAELGGYPERSC